MPLFGPPRLGIREGFVIMLAITDANYEELAAQGKPMVLDFWATWCGPCKKIASIIEALGEEYAERAIIGKVDVEESKDLAVKFGVCTIPTVLYIKDGKVVDKQVSPAPRSVLEEKLKGIL